MRRAGWVVGGLSIAAALVITGCDSGGSSRSSSAGASVAASASTISPAFGLENQVTPITITGQGLSQVTSATLIPDGGGAGTLLQNWVAGSDSQATAEVPAGLAVDDYRLDLSTASGVVPTPARFEVRSSSSPPPPVTPPPAAAPTITALAPAEGPNDRTVVVTIRGTNFVAGATVTVGGRAAATVTVRSATELDAAFPAALPAGASQVVVDVNGASSAAATWTALNALDPDQPGAFQVGTLDVQVPGATGDRPDARIYYPALTAGANAAVDNRAGPCPVVVYSHGFRPPLISFGIGYLNNAFIAAHLASFGYVVLSIDQSPNNDLFGTGQANSRRDADDVVAALDYLQAANADPAHPLLGFLDTSKAAFAGHSRGADGSIIAGSAELAANGTTRLKALVAYGPPSNDSQNNNTPLVFGNFTAAPTLLIGATNDAVAPFSDQGAILAQSGAPSMAIEIDGGNHSFYKDNDTGILGDGAATITLADQQLLVQRYTTAWLNAQVKGLQAPMAPLILNGAAVQADARLRSVQTR